MLREYPHTKYESLVHICTVAKIQHFSSIFLLAHPIYF